MADALFLAVRALRHDTAVAHFHDAMFILGIGTTSPGHHWLNLVCNPVFSARCVAERGALSSVLSPGSQIHLQRQDKKTNTTSVRMSPPSTSMWQYLLVESSPYKCIHLLAELLFQRTSKWSIKAFRVNRDVVSCTWHLFEKNRRVSNPRFHPDWGRIGGLFRAREKTQVRFPADEVVKLSLRVVRVMLPACKNPFPTRKKNV